MRLVFFLGGLLGLAFTTFCFAHVPAQARDLLGNNGHDRLVATAFFFVTLVGLAFTYLCVKEVFAPPRAK
jgi:hypothetical protein